MYYIYRITNTKNGKTYIGQRKCPKNKLASEDTYMGSGIIIKQAIQKEGVSFFTKEILREGITSQEESNLLEKKYICEERSRGKAEYNIASGGDGGNVLAFATMEKKNASSQRHSIAQKRVMQNRTIEEKEQVVQNWKTAFYNRTEEQQKVTSMKKKLAVSNIWKTRTPEEKQKIREKTRMTKLAKFQNLSEEDSTLFKALHRKHFFLLKETTTEKYIFGFNLKNYIRTNYPENWEYVFGRLHRGSVYQGIILIQDTLEILDYYRKHLSNT